MKLSVVVPAHDEERELAACLDHLLAQSLPIDEIIVVDNDSNDRTGEVAGEYARRFPRFGSSPRSGEGWRGPETGVSILRPVTSSAGSMRTRGPAGTGRASSCGSSPTSRTHSGM